MCLGRIKLYTCIWSIWLGIRFRCFFFVFFGTGNVLLMSSHNFVRLPWRDQPKIRVKWTKIKMTTIYMLNRGQFDLYIWISIMCCINLWVHVFVHMVDFSRFRNTRQELQSANNTSLQFIYIFILQMTRNKSTNWCDIIWKQNGSATDENV